MKAHASRTVRVFGLYHTAPEGTHFGIVRSGTWREVIAHLNAMHPHCTRRLFFEGTDGALRPLLTQGGA